MSFPKFVRPAPSPARYMTLQLTHSMTSKDFKKIIIDKLTEILKPNGFKKSGSTFSSSNGDLTYFVNLQSSQSSTPTILKTTVNIEIYSATVYKLQDTSLPEKWSRHFTERIGSLLDNPHDKWWTIENKKQAINDILKGHTVYFSVTNQAGYAKHYLLACDIEIIKIQQKNNTSIDYVAFKNIDDPYDDNRRTEIEALLDYKDKKDTIGKMKDFWTIKVA